MVPLEIGSSFPGRVEIPSLDISIHPDHDPAVWWDVRHEPYLRLDGGFDTLSRIHPTLGIFMDKFLLELHFPSIGMANQ